jgi:hypothetical protein
VEELEAKLRSLMKGKYSSMTIAFNDCSAPSYQEVSEYLESDFLNNRQWVSNDSKNRAIQNNSMWDIHWYPDTPIGFCQMSGATLHEVLEAVIGDDIGG